MAEIVYDGYGENMIVYAVIEVKPDASSDFKKVLSDFLVDLLQTEIRYLYDMVVLIENDKNGTTSYYLREFSNMYFSLAQQEQLQNYINAKLQTIVNTWA